MLTRVPDKYSIWIDLYDDANLPPSECIELMQFLIDIDHDLRFGKYQQICDYFIDEGLCYSINI
jgi:hypothetical protein